MFHLATYTQGKLTRIIFMRLPFNENRIKIMR